MVSIDKKIPQEIFDPGSVSLETSPGRLYSFSPDVLDTRTSRALFAMDKSFDPVQMASYKQAISSGREDEYRQNDAREIAKKRRDEINSMIQDFASQKKGPVTSKERMLIQDLMQQEYAPDYRSAWEQEYARKVLNEAINPETQEEALLENQKTFGNSELLTSEVLVKTVYAQKIQEELMSRFKEGFTSLRGTPIGPIPKSVGDILTAFIPFSGNIFQRELLIGSGLKEETDALWSLPLNGAFEATFEAEVERLASENILEALDFVQTFLDLTTSGQVVRDLLPAIDAIDLASIAALRGVVKGGAKGGRAAGKGLDGEIIPPDKPSSPSSGGGINYTIEGEYEVVQPKNRRLSEKLLRLTSSVAKRDTPEETLEATGEIKTAGLLRANKFSKQDFLTKSSKKASRKEAKETAHHLPSTFDPWKIAKEGQKKYGRAWGNHLTTHANELFNAATSPELMRIAPEDTLVFGFERTAGLLRGEITRSLNTIEGLENLITDFTINDRFLREDQVITGVPHVEVTIVSPEGDLFASKEAAEAFNELMVLKAHRIQQETDGQWSLIYSKPVDFSDPVIRERFGIDTEAQTPGGIVNRNLGRFRATIDLISDFERGQRGTAIHLQQKLADDLRGVYETIGNLRKGSKEKLEKVLEENRDFRSGTDQGRFFKTQMELENEWRRITGDNITPKEAEAYWTSILINDFDYYLRNIALVRGLQKRGYNKLGFTFSAEEKSLDINFNGKLIDELPLDSPDTHSFNVAIIDDNTSRVYSRSDLQKYNQFKKSLEEKLQNGYRIAQVANPLSLPLIDATKSGRITHFVVFRPKNISNVDLVQFPYNDGGHRKYATPYYIKQPNIRGTRYLGDNTLYGIEVEAMGQKYANRLNQAVKLYNEEQNGFVARQVFDDYVTKNLPHKPSYVRSMFEEKIDPKTGQTVSPTIDPNGPKVEVTNSGSILGRNSASFQSYMREKGIVNEIDNPWNDSISQEFSQERSDILRTISEEYDEEHQQLIKTRPARQVSPLQTQTNSMSSLLTDATIGKATETTAEQFLELLGDLHPNLTREQIRQNPVHYLMNFDPSTLKNLDAETQAKLRNLHRSTLHFVGRDTNFGKTWWNDIANSLINEIYKNTNQKVAERVTKMELHRTKDPARFFRAVAFHSKLGFLNPVQIFVQGQTLAISWAISPKHAIHGASAGYFLRLTKLNSNPEVIKGMSNKLKAFGWKAGEFEELHKILHDGGFKLVEGEISYLDDLAEIDIIGGAKRKVANTSSFFFREIERFLRLNAYSMAYKEWKDLNPGVRLGLKERQQILNRAKDLTVNMTREANANLQQGAALIPTQFWTYQLRMQDLMWSKRLTFSERAKVVGVYSILYGVPAAASLGFGFWPFRDHMKEFLLAKGINPNEGAQGVFLNGLVQTGLRVMFGEEYAVSDRLAAAGIPVLYNYIFRTEDEDRDLATILGGASGSIAQDIWGDLSSIRKAFFGWLSATQDDDYPLTMDDFTATLQNISTLSQATRLYLGVTTGKYITKNGLEVADVDVADSLIASISGVSKQEINDTFRMRDVIARMDQAKEEVRPLILKKTKNYFDALNENNTDKAQAHFKQLKALVNMAGYRPDELASLQKFVVSNLGTTYQQDVLMKFVERMIEQGKLTSFENSFTDQLKRD